MLAWLKPSCRPQRVTLAHPYNTIAPLQRAQGVSLVLSTPNQTAFLEAASKWYYFAAC